MLVVVGIFLINNPQGQWLTCTKADLDVVAELRQLSTDLEHLDGELTRRNEHEHARDGLLLRPVEKSFQNGQHEGCRLAGSCG